MVVGWDFSKKLVGSAEIIGVSSPGRSLPSHHGGARRRANRATRVTICEIDSSLCEFRKVWSFVKWMGSVQVDVFDAQIIGDDHHHIARFLRRVNQRGHG